MNQQNKKYSFIKSFGNNERLWRYTIELTATVVDYFRSSLYSIITSVIISPFFLKLDSLTIPSKIVLTIGGILLLLSARYLTKVSLALKKLENNYKQEKRNKSIEDWIYEVTADSVTKYARHTRKAILFFSFSLLLFIASSLLNVKEKVNQEDKAIIQKVDSLDRQMEELKSIDKAILQKLDSINFNSSIHKVDTTTKKIKQGH